MGQFDTINPKECSVDELKELFAPEVFKWIVKMLNDPVVGAVEKIKRSLAYLLDHLENKPGLIQSGKLV